MENHTDADPDEAPHAADRPLRRSKRVSSLPGPRSPTVPPALGGPSPTVEETPERVPATEVSVSPRHIYVTVELPDAAKDAIEVEATERTLAVRAPRSRGAAYRLTVGLPAAVRPESAKATFRNGILDVTLERTGGSTDDR